VAGPRLRTDPPLVLSDASIYGYFGGAQPPPYAPVWSYFLGVGRRGMTQIMSDWVTPDYKRLIAKGQVINHGMSRVNLRVTPSDSTGRSVRQVKGAKNAQGQYQWAIYNMYGDIMSHVFGSPTDGLHTSLKEKYPLPVSQQSLINKATIEAMNRVEPAKSQSLVIWLERHKTFDMIIDRTKKLASVVQAVKKGDLHRLEFMFPGKRTKVYPKRVVLWDANGNPITGGPKGDRTRYGHLPLKPPPSKMEDARKLWLEYRYGWTPLVHDIVDSLKAIYADDLRNQLTQHERFTARGKATFSGQTVSSVAALREFFGTSTAESTASHDFTVRAYILYRMSSEFGLARRLNDFGAFDVPRAIWEVVPWSFVIDWFVPIGDYLGAMTPKVGVEVIASGYQVKYNLEVSRKVKSWVPAPSSGDLAWDQSPIALNTGDLVSLIDNWRIVPLPLPTYPPVEVKLNLKRMVDAVASFKGLR